MSGKRRRSETSWDMKQDKMPPPESSDPTRRPSWEGNRNMSRNDDISRDNKHRTFDDEWGKQHTTRLPYRDRSRSRSRGREWESRRSPFYDDRYKSNDYGDHVRNNSRPCRDFGAGDRREESSHSRYSRFPHHRDDRNHYDEDDGRRQSNRISKIQCKFFAVGKCYRDDCKFSHDVSASDSQDYDRRSHDNTRAHKSRTWHHDQQPHADDLNASDLSEKKKSWGGPTWDASGGFHENKKTTWDSHNFDDKKKPWNGPSWDDDHVRASGFSKKPSYNSEDTKLGNDNSLDEKTKSWSGPLWDDPGLKEKGCEKNDHFLPKQHNVVNDSHINNDNIVSEQILTSGEGQVENGKSSKTKQELVGNLQGIAENAEKEQEQEQEKERINAEKVEKGNIGNDEKSREVDTNRSRSREWERRSPFYDDRQKSSEYGNHVRSNSGGDNLRKESWSHRQDYSRSNSHNRNSRNHYDDDDDDRCRRSNRVTKIQCKFFAAGNCNRNDCRFSHDVSDAQNYDGRSHDNPRAHKKMTCHADDLKASDLSEKNKSWDDVEAGGLNEKQKRGWESQNCDDKKKSTTRDDMSNLNLDNKNRLWNGPSWDEEDASKSNAKWGTNIDDKSTLWVKMDNNKKMRKWDDNQGGLNEKGYEKNDHFLLQKHNVVNDSHLNNSNVFSEEPNQQMLTSGKEQVPVPVTTEKNLENAIDYLKSLPNSTTHNQEGNIGNDAVMEIENGKTPEKKQEPVGKRQGSENAKQEQEQEQEQEHVNHEKVKEGNNGNDEKCMRQFRAALVEFVKEILKPKWKEGRMTREVYKSVVKKVIDKITTTIQEVQIPKTQPKIELYLTHSKTKIMKLVEAYVEKLGKA